MNTLSQSKLERRRLLADLLFLADGLTAAALLTLPADPPPAPVPVVFPSRSSYSGILLP